MWKEFKEFAFQGNLVDMAVAFVLGVAFSSVVDSVVNDIIMPVVGIFTGGINFADQKIVLAQEYVDAAGETIPENAITYGQFIQTFISFLIVALVLFLIVKSFMKLKKKKVEEPAAAPEPTTEEKLLTEIRDLLKK